MADSAKLGNDQGEMRRVVAEDRKFLTVGQAIRGGGPPMDLDEALTRMDQAAERWAKRLKEEPWVIEAFLRDRDCCDPRGDDE